MRPEYVEYDVVDGHLGVITFRRPPTAGAHCAGDAQLLRELDDAWQTAGEDSRVRVIVLRSTGRHFFACPDGSGAATPIPAPRGGDHDWEIRQQVRYARLWRDIPKPAVAAVQGRCATGGVLLCSPCDHVVAAEDAEFTCPPPDIDTGGPRAVRECPPESGTISAVEARDLGMVTTVVPLAALHSTTLALARGLHGS